MKSRDSVALQKKGSAHRPNRLRCTKIGTHPSPAAVRMDNLQVLDASLYVAANGCERSAPPAHSGAWHTVYMRMQHWSRAGALDQGFERLQRHRLMQVRLKAVCLEVSIAQVHTDGTGAPRQTAFKLSRAEAADERNILTWSLTAGQAGRAGRLSRCLKESRRVY